ncbi:Serine/threonine-protein kinase 32C [Desmophyllum pertusum]|uniref:Serine/threonine-protein kinase 32C n=1 Tax=Desmophyllum pertusum TaxID=174260 RepID=A0A9W9YCL5_9CNID|nr:Serine/threonine-protein kinase 32C [Desmophyllum pertusum]
MGAIQSNRKPSYDANGEVDFDHFQILRAIGKGAFGKVCIVQKKDTKAMYAMKYMNKYACIKKDAVRNVLRELEILKFLEHPFLVNLWFAFQDEEDMFMVVDLLLGGDIRYHLQQVTKFDEPRVKLYLCELGSALGYLRSKKIIHRDLKPDNLLLDEKGHVHLTDFNIATILEDGKLATSMSGTKPYMAPEIFATACEDIPGYSFGVDWWSLGVCIYEILRSKRPYEIHANTGLSEVRQIFASESVHYPTTWSREMMHVLHRLLQQDPKKRLNSIDALKQESLMADVDWESVETVNVQPGFVPSKDHLNCDPTYELEEMIIEAKPLHKKKKRLKKLSSRIESQEEMDPVQICLEEIKKDFKLYNREKSLLNRRPTKATCTPSLTENNEAKIAETTITDLDVTQS